MLHNYRCITLRRHYSGPVRRAFSLVEVLAAIAIIGIITFLAIPNIVRMKEDGERSLAIARAEALNMGMASYLQGRGVDTATNAWANKTDQERYNLVAPYLAFAPAMMTNYLPEGYSAAFPASLMPITKVQVSIGGTNVPY